MLVSEAKTGIMEELADRGDGLLMVLDARRPEGYVAKTPMFMSCQSDVSKLI